MSNTAETQNNSFITVDDSEDSSGYATSIQSSTDSLASSLNKYLEENGRRYHAYYGPDKNFMPSDEDEKDRLDVQHEAFRLLLEEKIYKAPVEEPQKVLDLGTGTGIWCIDFAELHPQAEVTGIDLSPIQPAWVPPNCKFETDDLELEWTFPKNSYDFIHSRNILSSIKDVTKYLGQIYSSLKPGAFVEVSELDGRINSDDDSLPENWPPSKVVKLGYGALEKTGRKWRSSSELVQELKDAGFVDIDLAPIKLPMWGWPKDKRLKQAGMLQQISLETGYQSYALALLTRVLGMDVEEAAKLCDAARDADLIHARKLKVHNYIVFNVVVARKPETETL